MLERDKKTISMLYNTTCSSYDELYGQEQYEKYSVLRCIENEHIDFITWLDLGCGTGLILSYITEEMAHITPKLYYVGIDISYNCIRNAVGKSKAIFSDFIVGDAEHPPIRIDGFSLITSFTTIHHFEDPVGTMVSYMENTKAMIITTILKREENLGKIIEDVKNYIEEKGLWTMDIIEIGKDIAIIINKKQCSSKPLPR